MRTKSGVVLAVAVGLSALNALAQEEGQQPRAEERRPRERETRVERQDPGPGERVERREQRQEIQRIEPRQDRSREGDRPQSEPGARAGREGAGPRIQSPAPRPRPERPGPGENRNQDQDRPPRQQPPGIDREESRSGPREPELRPRVGGGPRFQGNAFGPGGPRGAERPQFQPQEQLNLRRELSLLRQEIQRLERLLLESRSQRPEFRGRTPGPVARAPMRPRNQFGPGPRDLRGPSGSDRDPRPRQFDMRPGPDAGRQPRFQPEQRFGPNSEFRPGGPRQPERFGGPENPPQPRGPAFQRGDEGPRRPVPPARDRERQPDRD